MRILANTRNMTHKEWASMRQASIGGSDAAAVCGLNPYSTLYTLWADKSGRLQPKEETEAMRQGRDLEEYVAKRFEEYSRKKVRRNNHILQHDTYDFITANIDREVVGEKAGLECKTTSVMNLKRFKNGEYPDQYYVQCVHYMAVTGYPKWYLAVLILNHGFHVFEIERDEEEIAALLEAERNFWQNYMIPDMPPPPDGTLATERAIRDIFTDAGGECELAKKEDIERYLILKEQRKQLDREIRLLEQGIKINMGDCETGYCGEYTVTWSKQKRTAVSKKRLQQVYPNIDLRKVMKTSSYRKFAVKKEEPTCS